MYLKIWIERHLLKISINLFFRKRRTTTCILKIKCKMMCKLEMQYVHDLSLNQLIKCITKIHSSRIFKAYPTELGKSAGTYLNTNILPSLLSMTCIDILYSRIFCTRSNKLRLGPKSYSCYQSLSINI